MPRRLILQTDQSPGDVLMLTAAVRDLHRAHVGQFKTDVRTPCPELWKHNPNLTTLDERDPGIEAIDVHYPLIHQANRLPFHFIHAYHQFLQSQLGVPVPVTDFRGDVHLADEELAPHVDGLPDRFWIVVAGGKWDFTAKWWAPSNYQAVVDQLAGRVQFVQCGEEGHFHPRLSGVLDLVGKTTTREFMRLMYHAAGVLCPVTFAMHLAAAVPTRPGRPALRPCVVVAGGRESAHWEAYPGHQFIHTVGALECCESGGCWRSRCQKVGDGDPKDVVGICLQPVQVTPELRMPRCMEMIAPKDVIRRIEFYLYGCGWFRPATPAEAPRPEIATTTSLASVTSVAFRHGLGDCANFARLIPLYLRRGHRIAVQCNPDKEIVFRGAGAEIVETAEHVHDWPHAPGGRGDGAGQGHEGNKTAHNISESPLPSIGDKGELWPELCRERVRAAPLVPAAAVEAVRERIAKLARPIVLLHTIGNTAQAEKSLPDGLTSELYAELVDRFEGSVVLLDWDDRVPRSDSPRVVHLSDLHGHWPTEDLIALIDQADLLVGVDSGPLHLCGLTDTPSVGVWPPAFYPSRFALPRQNQINIVLAEPGREWNRFRRLPWNLVEHPGSQFEAWRLADSIVAMLEPCRYLPEEHRAVDVQLQQWILKWSGAPNRDRDKSFDLIFRECRERFPSPTIVETGTMRAEEDWTDRPGHSQPGAGFFTYLAGRFVSAGGGVLHAVDLEPKPYLFAQKWCEPFGKAARIYLQDSVGFLRDFPDMIDVLYLDSLDTDQPGHAEHCLAEIEAALPKLSPGALVVVDDSPSAKGAITGKAALAVPFLRARGWNVIHRGYQVVLSKRGGLIRVQDFWVREDNVQQDLVIVRDVAEQDCYELHRLPMSGPILALDVGAHIGCFAKRLHQHNPEAQIIAAECCPENIAALERNAGDFASILQAAVTYESNVALLSGVYPNCESTGGNAVVPRTNLEARLVKGELLDTPAPAGKDKHWADFRPLRTVTVEEILAEYGLDRIDVLKLDCEGSEFSILGKTPSLDRIGLIAGEYHGRERFMKLVAERFAGWDLRILKDAEIGLFWLGHPDSCSLRK